MSVTWSPPRGRLLGSVACVALGLFALAVWQRPLSGQASKPDKTALYASVGPELTRYTVDVEHASMIKESAVTLPENVQEAWPHPSKRFLYVTWSNGGPSGGAPGNGSGARGNRHGVTAFMIDPMSGALRIHGEPTVLPARPIHATTDISGEHLLVAYNDPSGLTVHKIAADGTIGSQVTQPALDVGIYAHQVRVDPANKMVILVTRGNGPAGGRPEDPGALKVFGYKDGVLTNRTSIAPGGGFNFQVRHLDFHPSLPWVFVSLERQNKLQVYRRMNDEIIGSQPLFTKDSLADPANVRAGQAVGTLRVHPNGRFVYMANRASGTTDFEGKRVFAGGENTIAVYAIDQKTGEPTLIQNIDTRGMHPRTISLDKGGRVLAAANQMTLPVREGSNVTTVPASVSLYRIREDGKLEFARKYDVDAGGSRSLFWMGIISLP